MKIILKDSINSELKAVRLRPGAEISSNDVNKITGAVQFTLWRNGFSYDCVVWPEDYEIVTDEKPETIQIPESETTSDITLPLAEVTNALDAMFWCLSPYLDYSDFSEYPWIESLIKSYNSIVVYLPHPWNLRYHHIDK
ncbi:MAG: hypothetical protein IPF54_26950 [Draconibacterium sp.]|nr:hypothetical protein [Draconibacterium sp.]